MNETIEMLTKCAKYQFNAYQLGGACVNYIEGCRIWVCGGCGGDCLSQPLCGLCRIRRQLAERASA